MTVARLHRGERAAGDARSSLNLGSDRPIDDLLEVAETRFAVPVLVDRFRDPAIAGVFLRAADDDPFIAVNADLPPVRQRFTLAHELGHLHLRHRPHVDAVAEVFGTGRKTLEVEANYFAAEFLAPRAAVTEWLQRHDLVEDAAKPETVVQLGLAFGVAFTTACFRLERAGLISSAAKSRLLATLRTESGPLAQRYRSHRLSDGLELLWQAKAYPRAPRQTVALAEEARSAGLLDEEQYRAITGQSLEIDGDDWL